MAMDEGQYDGSVDIWSIGITCIEMGKERGEEGREREIGGRESEWERGIKGGRDRGKNNIINFVSHQLNVNLHCFTWMPWQQCTTLHRRTHPLYNNQNNGTRPSLYHYFMYYACRSEYFKDFIRSCLQKEPEERLTAAQALQVSIVFCTCYQYFSYMYMYIHVYYTLLYTYMYMYTSIHVCACTCVM